MFMLNWLQAKKSAQTRKGVQARARPSFAQTSLPVISPRRGRRILRREQLFSIVRESMIRGGALSSSYAFKVLTLDANGDSFLVLIDLALPVRSMPDEYLLEIERWIQDSSRTRHDMTVRSVYWRRKAVHDQHGLALNAAVAAQARREAQVRPDRAMPAPGVDPARTLVQAVGADELEAFQQALRKAAKPLRPGRSDDGLPVPESHSDFSVLSDTQHGKL